MGEIFLSASVPMIGRGDYHETADPFLIQIATRELIMAVIRQHVIVWGGHPSITPMVWAICEDLNVSYADAVVLYQSRFFGEHFPEENAHFGNVHYIDAVDADRDASLVNMRQELLSRPGLMAAVFIGGMEGVEVEYELFSQFHPEAQRILVPSAGGAARKLAERDEQFSRDELDNVDFAGLFRRAFPPVPAEDRHEDD